jgi:tetratricopeptide (TPR) repeat protein
MGAATYRGRTPEVNARLRCPKGRTPGDLATAGWYFERVLAVNPRDVETRFNLALLLERLGRRDDALRHYQEFLRLDPVDYPDLVPRVQERIRNLEREPGP